MVIPRRHSGTGCLRTEQYCDRWIERGVFVVNRMVLHLVWVLAMGTLWAGCKNWGATLNPYTCESGRTVEVKYPSTQTAFLYYKGRRYRLRLADPSAGERFRDNSFDWRTEGTGPGSTGILTRVRRDGSLETEFTERCVEDD